MATSDATLIRIACEKLGIDVGTVESVNVEHHARFAWSRVVLLRAGGKVRRTATVTDEEIARWPG